MNIKKYITNIILILMISILFPQNLETFIQKINLENSLRNKIYSELERNFDSKFIVIVNLEIGRYGDLIDESNNQNRSNTNSRGDQYMPGIPLSRSKSNNNQQTLTRQTNLNDSVISEIDIEVWVEPTFNNEKMLESLIKGVIPDLAPCDNCVRIQAMNFNTQTNGNSELAQLKKDLEELKAKARKDTLIELNLQLKALEAQLSDSDSALTNWKDYQDGIDSLRLVQLEGEREDDYQNAKIKNEEYLGKLLNKDGGSGDMEGKKDGWSLTDKLITAGIFLAVLSVIAFLMIMINKKSVVYLKPKGDNNSNS